MATNDSLIPSGDKHQLPLWNSPFDGIRQYDEQGNECWSARELSHLLGYTKWTNFKQAMSKAKKSLRSAGIRTADHIADISKMVNIGSDAQREVEDFKLTRLACYHIAMNGDTTKTPVAEAQLYFAIQTRRQELSDEARARKRQQDITAYQLLGKPHDWSHTRVAAKEATREQNAAIYAAHVNHAPDYGEIAGAQNRALFEMSKREIVAYLGLQAKQADQYRDSLGKWANEAVRISAKEITRQIAKTGRALTDNEIVSIVILTSRKVAEHARALAEMDNVDYLSGAPLDENGKPIIPKNIRLLGSGK